MAISRALIRHLRQQFRLDWHGIHGVRHWARVRANGLRLCPLTGANPRAVEAFAFLHDSQRANDDHDPEHGPRAAGFVRGLPAALLDLTPAERELVAIACEGHSEGWLTGEVSVITCWDADRLDLGRVGIRADPARLCTAAARDAAMIEWAYRRSRGQR